MYKLKLDNVIRETDSEVKRKQLISIGYKDITEKIEKTAEPEEAEEAVEAEEAEKPTKTPKAGGKNAGEVK